MKSLKSLTHKFKPIRATLKLSKTKNFLYAQIINTHTHTTIAAAYSNSINHKQLVTQLMCRCIANGVMHLNYKKNYRGITIKIIELIRQYGADI